MEKELLTEIRPSGRKGIAYPLSIRTAALQDYLSGMRRIDVLKKYSLHDPSVLSHWKRKFASSILTKHSSHMVRRRNKRILQTDSESSQLARIKELERALFARDTLLRQREKELNDLQIHLRLNDTMIDLAEEQFGVEIRKNFGSKQ